jgi:hypothetical protein
MLQGLDLRLDLSSGKRFGRLIAGSPQERKSLHSRAQALRNAAAERLHNEASSPPQGEKEPVEQMKSVLMSLPEPEPDLEQAVRSGVTGEALDAIVRKVWERRQQVLREFSARMQTEGQQMSDELRVLHDPASSVEAIERALMDLEYHVSSAHNAVDFRNMGGIEALTPFLNSSVGGVRAAAAWALGTAVKYEPASQTRAMDNGAALSLVSSLEIDPAVWGCGVEDASCLRLHLEPAARALYALGSLCRGAPLTVPSHLVHLKVPQTLASLVQQLTEAGTSGANDEVKGVFRALAVKAWGVLGDVAQGIGERRDADPAPTPPEQSTVTVTVLQDDAEQTPDAPNADAVAAAKRLLEASLMGGPCGSVVQLVVFVAGEPHEGAREAFFRQLLRAAEALPLRCHVEWATGRAFSGPPEVVRGMLSQSVGLLEAQRKSLMDSAAGAVEEAEDMMDEVDEPALAALARATGAIDAANDVEAIDHLLRPLRAGLEALKRA